METVWEILGNEAVVTTLVAILCTVLGWVAVKLRLYLMSKLGKEKLDRALEMAEIVATGVEQMAERLGWSSKEKFDEAQQKLKGWAKSCGISFTDAQWESIIEKTVLELSGVWKQLKSGSTP
ncbi:MAG TPA: phage holin, LLH family [Caldisericia bacterium]|nr:hypothetical protein [Caldisericales bacterium]HPL89905.1 phage holin, LLH family [Caldisericia bacterium]